MEHRLIPDNQIHEPKGIVGALVDQVYVANGAGSGTWKELPILINSTLVDVSEPSFILVPIPVNVRLQSIRFVLEKAITVANSVVTVTRGGDNAALGSTTITFSGSGEGTVFDLTPTFANSVIDGSANQFIKIASDGASTTASRLFVSVRAKVI